MVDIVFNVCVCLYVLCSLDFFYFFGNMFKCKVLFLTFLLCSTIYIWLCYLCVFICFNIYVFIVILFMNMYSIFLFIRSVYIYQGVLDYFFGYGEYLALCFSHFSFNCCNFGDFTWSLIDSRNLYTSLANSNSGFVLLSGVENDSSLVGILVLLLFCQGLLDVVVSSSKNSSRFSFVFFFLVFCGSFC